MSDNQIRICFRDAPKVFGKVNHNDHNVFATFRHINIRIIDVHQNCGETFLHMSSPSSKRFGNFSNRLKTPHGGTHQRTAGIIAMGLPEDLRQPAPAPLDKQVGMDMMECHPKDAVRRFFNRYTAKPATSSDYFYQVQKADGGKICELHTPSFYSRVFQGTVCKTIKDAETSAAEKFCQDPDVQAAAVKLPPNMKACRRSAGSGASKRQWQAREDHGDVATKRQRAEKLLSDFKG